MKEIILNLFYEEVENELDKKISVQEKEKESISCFCKFLKRVILVILVFFLFKIGEILIFQENSFNYGIVHNIVFGLIIMIFSNLLIDYYYVKEIIKISSKNIDKDVVEKTKYIFVSIMLSTILGIHNIGYDFLYIISNNKTFFYSEKYIYYIIAFSLFLMIIAGFIIGSTLINNIFKQMKSLTDETDGII